MPKDHYKTLGVSKTASEADIKSAFRKLAHQYHPDKNKGDDKKFKEINEAYQTLSDKQKRAQYDQFGSAGASGFGGAGGGNPFGGAGAGGFDFNNFDFSQFSGQAGQGGFEFDLGDIFGAFGGQGFGGRGARTPRGNDIETQIKITFKEAVFGVEKKITLNKVSTCSTCSGSGAKPGSKMNTCKTCEGQGRVTRVQRTILGNIQSATTCDTCFGTGKIPEQKCDTCRGAGVVREKTDITITIPAGLNNGDTLRMNGAGEAVPHGTSGDLFIHLAIESHPVFKRSGNDLIMPLEVSLADALLGTTVTVDTLDGPEKLEIPEGAATGDQLKIRGKGVAQGTSGPSGKRGDIIVGIKVAMPKRLSKKAKEAIEALRGELK